MTGPRRVAVVGAGPRALWATECLADAGADVAVTVLDPRPAGAGAAYDPAQPPYLRLNVTSSIVGSGLGRLDDWRRARGETGPLDPFPPRALVGEFWAESWAAVARRLELRHREATVSGLRRVDDRWCVLSRSADADADAGADAHAHADADGAPADRAGAHRDEDHPGERYDHVLLAAGHEDTWPGAWARRRPDAVSVFPVAGLTPERVPAGARVAIRGAALTCIDAVLALTEGRGGRFGPAGYAASGTEPALRPFSRHGRFMEPKPAPDGPLAALDLTGPRDAGRAAIAASPGSAACVAEAVRTTALAYLRVAGGKQAGVGARARDAGVDAVLAGTDRGDPLDDLRRSLGVVEGAERPHAAWAVGQAFRDLYPAIVASLSFERCPAADWSDFARLARTLERVAFGPPPVNAAKLLALGDAGVIAPPTRAEPDADARIDAVLPPPGVVPGSLVAGLVAAGVGALAPARRGLRVHPDASVPGAPGLAAVGRVTEDVVIGNDTLSRTLHDVVPRWAQKVSSHA